MGDRRFVPYFIDGNYEGMMTVKQIAETKNEFYRNAVNVLKESGADHVVYSCKEYADDGTVEKARFYSGKTYSDKEFETIAAIKNVVIGAVHKRR